MMGVLLVRYVQASTRVAELLRKTKVNHVDEERSIFIVFWDNKVGRLDVSVDEVARMHVLYPRNLKKSLIIRLSSREITCQD